MANREAIFQADVGGSSATGTQAEGPGDMAYRGVMPKALGRAIVAIARQKEISLEEQEIEGITDELYATLSTPDEAQIEAIRSIRQQKPWAAAIRVVSLLLLGLRKTRAMYGRMVTTWHELYRVSVPCPLQADIGQAEVIQQMPHAQVSPRDRMEEWLRTARGNNVITELRWIVPSTSVAIDRLRNELPPGPRPSGNIILKLLSVAGIPFKVGGQPS